MMEDFNKYKFPDKKNNKGLVFEVNYSTDDKVFPCKMIKWYVGDEMGFIEAKHLFEFLFTIGSRNEQRKMIPQELTRVKHYETIIGIKATKDIRKGEMINVPISITLPTEREEAIAEIKHDIINPIKVDRRTKGGIIVP